MIESEMGRDSERLGGIIYATGFGDFFFGEGSERSGFEVANLRRPRFDWIRGELSVAVGLGIDGCCREDGLAADR